jgi:hypothetical protein
MLTYNHHQAVSSSTWVVVHNFGTAAVVTDAFIITGGGQEKILPDTVVMTDPNTLTVTFTSNHTGSVRVVSG